MMLRQVDLYVKAKKSIFLLPNGLVMATIRCAPAPPPPLTNLHPAS